MATYPSQARFDEYRLACIYRIDPDPERRAAILAAYASMIRNRKHESEFAHLYPAEPRVCATEWHD